VGQERLGPSYFFISLVLGPLNSLLWYVPSLRYIWSSILFFVSARTNKRHHHHRRMDGFCNQNVDQLGSLAGLSLLTVYVGVVECAPASPPPESSSLTHARRMDGFCNQNANQLGSLAGLSPLTVHVGEVS
jgi:hypothetical protein